MNARINRATVLVLGNFRPGFTVVRALSRSGYRTIIGLWGGEGYVEFSRYTDEVWQHPPLTGNGDAFIATLCQFLVNRSDIKIVYPIAEVFVMCLAANAAKLPRNIVVASVNPNIVATCSDKIAMLKLATRNTVFCEPYRVVRNYQDIFTSAREIGYPTVIRPLTPLLPIGRKKALICASENQIREYLSEWPQDQHALLVQRRAEGVRHNVFFAAYHGRIIRSLETRIIRTDHFDETGYAVDGVTVPTTEGLHRDCSRLAQALDYTGIGLAQFILNHETGRSCFLELNPRIAGSHAITEYIGQDLTRLAITLAKGVPPTKKDATFEYQFGVRYAWTYGDLRGLKAAIREREVTKSQAVHWLLQACGTFVRAKVHMTWSWRDPLPTLLLFLEQIPGISRVFDYAVKPRRLCNNSVCPESKSN